MELAAWLITNKIISKQQLALAERNGGLLAQTLIDLGFIDTDTLLHGLSQIHDISIIKLRECLLDPQIVQLCPKSFAYNNKCLIFAKEPLSIAIADPSNILLLDQLAILFKDYKLFLSCEKDIETAILQYYPAEHSDPLSLEGEIALLIESLIKEAIKLNASDIHWQPQENIFRICYRIDGILQERHLLYPSLREKITIRLKLMASLDITESRIPQNGSFQLQVAGYDTDFRLSCHPTIYGENLVLRILLKNKILLSLPELGFSKWQLDQLTRLIQAPSGLLLLSGPTGAGKTTTLYAMLQMLSNKNIMTLEDPVEYLIPEVRQTEINKAIDFAAAMRSILRQDPDVILISEIRDSETAKIALRAALTGHLVLATVHAASANLVPLRLLDLGISPVMLCGNILACLHQILIRCVCNKCGGEGCNDCNQGYFGRTAVAELLLGDDTLNRVLLENANYNGLREWQQQYPKQTLDHAIADKICSGITTVAEAQRISSNQNFDIFCRTC